MQQLDVKHRSKAQLSTQHGKQVDLRQKGLPDCSNLLSGRWSTETDLQRCWPAPLPAVPVRWHEVG